MLATMRQTGQLVDFFRKTGRKLPYRKNEYIIRAGGVSPGVFYILEGIIKAYDLTRYGEENLLSIRKEHEVFPLIWAMTGQERQVAYCALTDATVLRVNREQFITFVRTHPEALAPLMDMAIEMYRLHSERIINLEYRTVRERIMSFLLTMSQRFGETNKNGSITVVVPLRHQDIASSINATRETTTRELRLLQRRGLVDRDQNYFILPNPADVQAQLSPVVRPTSSAE